MTPSPDTDSPFFDAEEWRANASHGRAGVRVLRAAEFSRNLDLLVLTEPENLSRVEAGLAALLAKPIAVPVVGAAEAGTGTVPSAEALK